MVLAITMVAGAACKAPVDHSAQDEIDATRLRNAMCLCLDDACRTSVREDLAAWERGVAARNSTAPLDEKTSALLKAFHDCEAMHVTGAAPAVTDAASVPDGSAALPTGPRPTAATFLAELWRAARENGDPELQLRSLDVRYVRSDGTLDPAYGELRAALGFPEPVAPRPVDDPKRPTGAPLPVLPAPPRKSGTCPELEWSASSGWRRQGWDCYLGGELLGHGPRCTVTELWKRAIAKGAPADALAVIRLQAREPGPAWSFTISDELRGVSFTLELPDDCDPVVEK